MANLNLSEFTEKLFVADADHTFIWDTQNAISKRVSRNSWLNSGTLTSDAPVTISQTWGTTGIYTAAKVNVTETATANTASLLLDLQLGSVSRVKVNKEGNLVIAAVSGAMIQCTASSQGVLSSASAFPKIWGARFDFQTAAGGTTMLGIGPTQVEIPTQLVFNTDTILLRDGAANTLALRNGAAAQAFNIYASYSDASNYSRLSLGPLTGGDDYYIITGNAGTGIARGLNLRVGTGRSVYMGVGTTDIFRFSTAGLTFMADNQYDIGASGANRPKNLYLSGFAVVGSSLSVGGDLTVGDTKLLGWISGRSIMSSPADGYIRFTDSFQTNFNRLQFGGTSASFPALKRVGTDLQVVVANTTAAIGVAAGDADLTFIEDRYRRKGAGTPEGVVTAPIGAVYHNTTGGAGTSFYVKESGTGNTGWVGK